MKVYENTQRIKISITIYLRIAQRWLRKLGYKYKNRYKDVFIKDYKNLLKKMKEFKLYIVEFKEESIIKTKTYLSDYVIKGLNWRLIIVITYNKYTFFVNDNIQKCGFEKKTHFCISRVEIKVLWLLSLFFFLFDWI